MKKKPNTQQFMLKKDPSSFLEGAMADRVEKEKDQTQPPLSPAKMESRIHREQKVFRLSLDLINALKKESYERSMKTGTRVTETELVEQAIRAFLNITI